MDSHDLQRKSVPMYAYVWIAFCAFGLSYLTTIFVVHWDTVNTLIYESSLAKYESMTGERGPMTYLIFHNDLVALQAMADKHEGILGVEQHTSSNVAKMAFASAKSPLIEQVRHLTVVSDMIKRNVPMICH